MADDGARIAQLEAENAALREREATLTHEVEHLRPALAEALEQQTATAEVLRIIASSPTAAQPVLDAVAERAARLCDTYYAALLLLDGDVLHTVARYAFSADGSDQHLPTIESMGYAGVPVNGSVAGRAVTESRTIHIPDATTLSAEDYPIATATQAGAGHRTMLAVPLVREGVAIGAFLLRRIEVRPFTEQQVALLETFADQAVIAIENARLFAELEQRNAELQESNRQVTEALEQQTATADILRVIASSPANLQSVLDAIVARAARLTDATGAVVWRVDGGMLHFETSLDTGSPDQRRWARTQERPIDWSSPIGQAALQRQTIRVDDFAALVGRQW